MENHTIKKDLGIFSRNTDAWSWLNEQLKDVSKEDIIEQRVEYNENHGDPSNTAYYTIRIKNKKLK